MSPSKPPRLLVVKLSSLGDLFHALPILRILKQATGAAIDWVTQTEYVDLVGCFEDVDRVIGFPRKHPSRMGKFLYELRKQRYDRILDLQGLLKSAWITRAARGGERIGPSFHREGAHHFYDRVAGPCNKERHAVEELLDVADLLDLSIADIRFPVHFPPFITDTPQPRIALIPRSRWDTKNWPPSRFGELAHRLRELCAPSLFLVGGHEDLMVCDGIQAAAPFVENLAGSTSLVGLGSLLAAMDLVITVDTGPMHMAAAAGTPVLALFGATDPVRTGPYGTGHRVLVTDGLDCRPCRSRVCARGDLACLERIGVERVAQTAVEMLKRVNR